MADIINILDRKADLELAAIVDGIADLERRVQAAIDSGLFIDPSNDNRRDSLCTGISSVAIGCIGGQWIVSHFLCGADGRPDFDLGEIQVTNCRDEKEARDLFRAMCLIARTHTSRLGKMRKAILRKVKGV
jgi:hypothetical protein